MARPRPPSKPRGTGWERRLHLAVAADPHGELGAVRRLAGHARAEGRAVLVAGDLLRCYVAEDLSDVPERTEEISRQLGELAGLEAHAVPGNHDLGPVYADAVAAAGCVRDVDRRSAGLGGGFSVVGWGGMEHDDDIVELFRMGNYYLADEVRSGLGPLLNGAGDPSYCVLLTHQPVLGHLSRGHVGQELGSAALAEAYEARPGIGLVVSGHSHQAGCETERAVELAVRPLTAAPSPGALRVSRLEGLGGEAGGVSIEYDRDQYELTCFLNPGSLGYAHSFAGLLDVDVYERGSLRRIEVSFGSA